MTDSDTEETVVSPPEKHVSPQKRLVRRILRGGLLLFCLMVAWLGYDYYVFKTAVPNMTRNYLLEQDQKVLKIPVEDRGWPLYREAIMGLDVEAFYQELTDSGFNTNEIINGGPSHPDWSLIENYLLEHRSEIELFLKGTHKPYEGYVSFLSDPASSAFAEKYLFTTTGEFSEEYLWFYSFGHNRLISITSALLLPAVLFQAEAEGDHEHVTEILISWFDLGKQISETGETNDESGMSVSRHAVRPLLLLLTKNPELFIDQELIKLQDRFAEAALFVPQTSSVVQHQALFAELLERIFAGDDDEFSFLCDQSFDQLPKVYGSRFSAISGTRASVYKWLLPDGVGKKSTLQTLKKEVAHFSLARLSANKNELREKYNEILELAVADRTKTWGDPDEYKHMLALREIAESPELCLKYWIVLQAFNFNYVTKNNTVYTSSSVGGSEHVLKHRAFYTLRMRTAQTAIALERYRRQHNSWPGSLDELVPEFLAQVPIDPFDDQPLRYKLEAGRPVVYSVGVNGSDEGGKMPHLKTNDAGEYLDESDMIDLQYQGDISLFHYRFVPFQ